MKTTITLLLIFFTSIATFGQTTETRYFNGKYTKETALEHLNKYINLQNKGQYKFTSGSISKYNIVGTWVQTQNAQNEITTNINYVIDDKGLTIKMISSVLKINGNAIFLSAQDEDDAVKKLYNNQVGLFINTLFKFFDIENNKSSTQTATIKSTNANNTIGQTTETRYFNGKYTKETALKKLDESIKKLETDVGQLMFIKTSSVSKHQKYQIDGVWANTVNAQTKLATNISYLIDDKSLTIEITNSYIITNGKETPVSAQSKDDNLKAIHNDIVRLYINVPFEEHFGFEKPTTTANSASANNTTGQTKITAGASSLATFSKSRPLYFKKTSNGQVHFYQDETTITPPDKFFNSHSGDWIAYYEPGHYYIFPNAENATLNTIIKPNYKFTNDFYYEVLSKDEIYINRKGKYLKLSDFKFYIGANGVLNFMFPNEDVTYISNMENGSLYSKYYSGGKFDGTDYLDIKKDKSFDLIRSGVRVPKSDYEVKVDLQNDNQAFIYYKGKKEFKISHYKSFFEQAYLRSITRVQ